MEKLIKHFEKNIIWYAAAIVILIIYFPKIKASFKKPSSQPTPTPQPTTTPVSTTNTTTGSNTSIVGTSLYTIEEIREGSKLYVKEPVFVIERDFNNVDKITTSSYASELKSEDLATMSISGLDAGSLKTSGTGLLGKVSKLKYVKIDGLFLDNYILLAKLDYPQQRWLFLGFTDEDSPINLKFPTKDGSKNFYKSI